jgi:hypothetical protein
MRSGASSGCGANPVHSIPLGKPQGIHILDHFVLSETKTNFCFSRFTCEQPLQSPFSYTFFKTLVPRGTILLNTRDALSVPLWNMPFLTFSHKSFFLFFLGE